MKSRNVFMILTLSLATALPASAAEPLAGVHRENLDESVSPREDFYQYACGGWQKLNPLKPEYSRYGSFDILGENNKKQLHELVEALRDKQHARGTVEQKIGDLYAMGMDSVKLNKDGANPVKADIARIANANREDLTDVIAWMHNFSSPFFGVGVMADLKNSDMNILYWGQGGLGLGDRDYYLLDDEQTVKIRNAYKEFVVKLLMLVGYDEQQASVMRDHVLDIETELAKAAMTRTEMRDLAAQYNIRTLTEVEKACPSVDWKQYLQAMYLPVVDNMCVMQTASLDKVNELLTTKDLQTVKDYLIFHLVNAASDYMSDDFRTVNFEMSSVISGAEQDKPRWKRALAVPDGMLGEALGQIYVAKYFPEESKQRMLELVGNLKTSLGEHIQALTWMSDATKQRALEKLAAFTVKIGYPDKWKDYSGIDINPDASYWENVKAACIFHTKDQNVKCGKPVDRAEWGMTPQTVNAYYNPTTNEICFPAGILQAPFFSPDAMDCENYGAIGVVIGHEMTHGFDDMGRQFDKVGNMVNWWTEEDAAMFNKLADQLVAQFDSIKVLGDEHANGRLTLGENIADQGGLRIAYSAYLKTAEAKANKTVDGFTPAQRFYLSYANVWADNIREEEILRRTKIDEHSLGRWRVNATLKNIDTFYEAFGIKPGDGMYLAPEKRVVIW